MLYPLSYGSALFNDANVSMRHAFAVNRETKKAHEREEVNAPLVLVSTARRWDLIEL